MKKLLSIALVIAALSSCKDASKKTYSIQDVAIMAEGPLFDGPNTMQAMHTINLNDIENGLLPEHIKSVKLTKAEVSTDDSVAFNNIRNFVLQFTAAAAQMQKAGVLNPVPKNTATVQISPAAEAELKDNFQQSKMYIVLDADLEGDRDENLIYTGNFEFEITYKK